MKARGLVAALLAWALFVTQLPAQDLPPTVTRPQVMIPIRDYMAPTIAPIRLDNSRRLYSLIRAGNLYLSAEDALALAIENNLNLEIDRYGPQLADSAFRTRAGRRPDPRRAERQFADHAPSTAESASTARLRPPAWAEAEAGAAAATAATPPFNRSARSRRTSTRFCRARSRFRT